MKKFLVVCTVLLFIFSVYRYIELNTTYIPFSHIYDEPNCFVTTKGKEILQITKDGEEVFEIKGVDMGTGIPGGFSTDFKADYDIYKKWFKLMKEMNANTVRIYTILDTEFYHAFYDFNKDNPDPLYLIQGVWVDDEVNRGANDAYDEEFINVFKEDCKKVVDVLHGKKHIWFNSRHGYGKYKWDVTDWVLGYILGVEWERDLVEYTNDISDYMSSYDGTFLYVDDDATAYEAMFARVGDELLTYEMSKYGDQRLLAFSNWPDTDPIIHETYMKDVVDYGSINVEHIHAKDIYKSGMFASYHIYPYFPMFYEFEERYKNYVDEEGKINPYRGYLKDINDFHSIPVIISEFGLPSSRGIARLNLSTGMNQGNLTEDAQAELLRVMYKDIKAAGCAGAIVFEWADEWFKRTWNTWAGVDLTRAAYWNDFQTNEQSFGLITFDPGKEKSKVYVDGDISEWQNVEWLYKDEKMGLKVTYDEKFMYFNVFVKNHKGDEVVYLPIDITPNSGAYSDEECGLVFERPTDFIIKIDGKDNSKMYVQEYYDMLYATERREVWDEDAFINKPEKDSSKFNVIQQLLRRKVYFLDETIGEAWLFPTGDLKHGIANPESSEFNSIADFNINNDNIELRIPWGLLNFSDPSSMEIHDDYYKHYGVEAIDINKMYISMQVVNKLDNSNATAPFSSLKLKGWGIHPKWHMRIKESYYAMKEEFGR